jgi:hypothetical protein
VRAARLAEPAHAVRQARGRKPHLRIAKALADGAEHVARGHAQAVEASTPCPPVKAAVHGVHAALDADARPVHVRQEHGGGPVFHAGHDDRVVGAASAPVMNHLRPVMT